MATEIELFESPELFSLDFCLWGWLKSEIYKRKADTRHKLLARIVHVAVRIRKRSRKTQTNNTPSLHVNCNVAKLYLDNHSELGTCLYELFFLTMTNSITPQNNNLSF